MKPPLTIAALKKEAKTFAAQLSTQQIPELYGVNDGKKVGTYVEIRLNEHLSELYDYLRGSAANGVDIPELGVDVKATSKKQPQSSSPFQGLLAKGLWIGIQSADLRLREER